MHTNAFVAPRVGDIARQLAAEQMALQVMHAPLPGGAP